MTDGFRNELESYNPGLGNVDKTAFGPRTGPGPDNLSGTEDDDSYTYNPAADKRSNRQTLPNRSPA